MSKRVKNRRGRRRVVRPKDYVRKEKPASPVYLRFVKALDRIRREVGVILEREHLAREKKSAIRS